MQQNFPLRAELIAALTAILFVSTEAVAQPDMPPVNSPANPYQTIEGWAKLPEGRVWGSTSAVEIDKDGTSIWVAERCGANNCMNSTLDPILKFDSTGTLVKSFGGGLLVSPHGIFVDRDGNIWVVDCACTGGGNRGGGAGRAAGAAGATGTAAAGGAAAGARAGGAATTAAAGAAAAQPAAPTKGHQIFKFSPDGTLLLTLGKLGGGNAPEFFFQPNDILVAPSGEMFVVEGHGQGTDRVIKFAADGRLIKAWGQRGTGHSEFNQPHALAMDSRGRLFVGDRGNNRIQIFDQDGNFLDVWYQFSRPSGIYIDAQDNIFVADSESGSFDAPRTGWQKGIRIGSARDGSVTAFIPDPDIAARGTSAAEGVAVDARGNVYGAEVGPRALKRYVRR